MTTDFASKTPTSAPAGREADPSERYAILAPVIDYLVAHGEDAPTLEETARVAGLSPAHFQRVFQAGVGVSPKRFLQFLAAGRAKAALSAGESVLGAALTAGLSGPSRLHDLLLTAEAMTPGAYRRKGEGLRIRYATVPGPFGACLIGATEQGICWLSFCDAEGRQAAEGKAQMQADWAAAEFLEDPQAIAPLARRAFAFAAGETLARPLALHVRGTNFQLKVWEALLRIPPGARTTYGDVARAINAPTAVRAVGAAVGANLISLLIPCHRVILASGVVHNYRWGPARKRALLALEDAMISERAGKR